MALCSTVPVLAAPRAESQPATASPVAQLMAAVKDAKTTEAKLGEGLFGMADCNGGLLAAVNALPDSAARDAAVAELIKLIQALSKSSRRADGLVCANAAYALGQLGPVAKPALPALALLQNHKVDLVNVEVREAVRRIGQ